MSDQLTDLDAAPAPPPQVEGGSARWRRSLLQALVIVLVFAAVGAAAGWLWNHLYDAPRGIAYQKRWLGLDEKDYRDLFSGTALYAIIAGLASLVLGAVLSFVLDRDELLTLAAVVVGAGLAGWLMYVVGVHLGNPDPDVVARTAADRTPIPGDLRLARWTVGLVWPAGGVLGCALVFFLTTKRQRAS
ncbi:hypothetical protein GCM10022215_01700 [Nocardioides fonticola]|uniref:DUF2567 domain-containing protein n=1 Tax=Nocardioides fonticola TaxID=450363 RepID=A0ABP7XAI5_9ACTN